MQSNDNEKNNSNMQSNNNKKNKLKAPLNDNEKKNRRMLQKLLYTIEQLPDDQLKATIHLLDTMRYFKEPNEGKLLSPYLQDKALNFISSSLYKVSQDSSLLIQNNKELQKTISRLEYMNAKKNHKINHLVGKLLQYKHKHKQYISKVYASARRLLLVDSQSLKIGILALLKKNKRQYTSQFISMATQVSQKVFNDDNECKKRANKLFKNLFGQ
ncbi:8037_t:CDS:2 [Cetraspora pellucida]|uniref:8037_t:CDS:1 n=1 Tax=Cetraspora pellucida TaxID=1433469 RepID=A0A9N9A5G4_9GLOM|nr:8037_t:CDS:2 [Cetraspora pellucida]